MGSPIDVGSVIQKPWWPQVKNEVARTVTVRIKAENRFEKPHGSVLGQLFIDAMSQEPEIRSYVHYLLTRNWDEVVEELKGDLSPQIKRTLLDQQGVEWFAEFKRFLSHAWNQSISSDEATPIFHILDRRMFLAIHKEWVLHVNNAPSAAALAAVMMEWMRDSAATSERRNAALNAYAFIVVRTWPEVLSALRIHEAVRDLVQDLEGLNSPKAEQFFNQWKALLIASVEEYWDSLVAKDAE